MNRRDAMKRLAVGVPALVISGALAPEGSCRVIGALEPGPLRIPINGVSVLRVPDIFVDDGTGKMISAMEAIRPILDEGLYRGAILALPGTRDENGNYLWDYRIEGGPTGQIKVERHSDGAVDIRREWTGRHLKE